MRNRGIQKVIQTLSPYRGPTAIIQAGVGFAREIDPLLKAFPQSDLIGFEPSPQFIRHWSVRGYPGTLVPCALSQHCGVVRLYRRRRMAEATSLYPRPQDVEFDEVPAISLDVAMPMLGNLGDRVLLWMDCEGSELSVVLGARQALRSVSWVVAEVAPSAERQYPDPDTVHDTIKRCGFMTVAKLSSSDWLYARRGFARRRHRMSYGTYFKPANAMPPE